MLNGISVNLGTHLANEYGVEKLIHVIAGSPLSALTQQINMYGDVRAQLDAAEVRDKLTSDSSSMDDYGENTHELYKAGLIDKISSIIARNRDVTKKIALPMIRQGCQYFNEHISAFNVPDNKPVHMTMVHYADIWNDDDFLNYINTICVPTTASPITYNLLNLGNFVVVKDKLFNACKTGVQSVDTAILNWLDVYYDENCESVRWLLSSSFARKVDESFKATSSKTIEKDINLALLLFLTAKHLPDIVEGEVSIPLNSLRVYCKTVEIVAHKRIINFLKQRSLDNSVGRLIKSQSYMGDQSFTLGGVKAYVVLSGDVYNKITSDGVEPEVVMGAILNKSLTTLADLKSRSSVYKDIYKKSLVVGKVAVRDAFVKHRLGSIYKVFSQLLDLSRSTEDKDALFDPQINDVELAKKLFDEWVGKELHNKNMDDELLVRDMVCCVFFPDYNVDFILNEMDSNEFDGITDPNEAACIVMCDLYARWVVSQLTVS